ncbi:MAG: hypothetical protein AAF703_20655 [Cyanobacteria bacterium P01_D01_bin.105]
MLTGIEAVKARWQSIKSRCSASDHRLLLHAMNQLVNNYATQEELIEELPTALQGIFMRLVDAYLNGFWLDEGVAANPAAVLSPAMLAAQQVRQRRRMQPEPTPASEATTYIIQGLNQYN